MKPALLLCLAACAVLGVSAADATPGKEPRLTMQPISVPASLVEGAAAANGEG